MTEYSGVFPSHCHCHLFVFSHFSGPDTRDLNAFDEVIMLDTSDIAHERLGQLRDALDDEFDLCGGDSPWGC